MAERKKEEKETKKVSLSEAKEEVIKDLKKLLEHAAIEQNENLAKYELLETDYQFSLAVNEKLVIKLEAAEQNVLALSFLAASLAKAQQEIRRYKEDLGPLDPDDIGLKIEDEVRREDDW